MLKLISAKIVNESSGLVKVLDKPDFIYLKGSKISIEVKDLQVVKVIRDGLTNTLLEGKLGETLNVSGEIKLGDVLIIGSPTFLSTYQINEFRSLPNSNNTTNPISPEAWIISFEEIKIPSPIPFLKSLAKLIPDKSVFVKNEMMSDEGVRSKKTTFSVGVILLILLGISIGFGVRQKKINENKLQTEKVQQALSEKAANGICEVTPELFLDLSLLSSGFKGDEIISSGEEMYVLDRNSKKIVSIAISTKKSEVVVGQGKLDNTSNFAAYEGRVFISDSEGIKEVDDTLETVVEKEWGGSELIYAFAGNIYVLDKNLGKIYRYSGSDSGFGGKQDWLSVSTTPDFSSAKSWAFDGSIYVVGNNKILKFSQGSPKNFSLDSQVISVDAVYADEENEFLYVLDRTSKTVFALDKDGKRKAQYSSDKIGEATGLAVSETEKKLILLTGEKLLFIDLLAL